VHNQTRNLRQRKHSHQILQVWRWKEVCHVGRESNDAYMNKFYNKRTHNFSLCVTRRNVKCDQAQYIKTIWFNKEILKIWESTLVISCSSIIWMAKRKEKSIRKSNLKWPSKSYVLLGLKALEIRNLVTFKHKHDILLRSAIFLGNRIAVLWFYGIFL
jgi:hypothetical protein